MSTLNKERLMSGIYGDRHFNIEIPIEENETLIAQEKPSSPSKEKSTKPKRKDETINQVAKKKTSLYLPPEKYKALKVLCAEMDISMTTFIEEAIDSKMKSEYRKRGKEAENQSAIES